MHETNQSPPAGDPFDQLIHTDIPLSPGNDAPAAPAPAPRATPAPVANDPYAWQKIRRRPGREQFFNLPISGFGPQGEHCLWLPSPTEVSEYQIEHGQPVLKQAPSCLNDPQIQAVRDAAFLSFQATGVPGVFSVGPAFLTYTVAVIRLNYRDPAGSELSDADLNFLLSGKRWHSAMVRHLLGGDDVIDRLCAMGTIQTTPIYSPPPPPPAAAPPQVHQDASPPASAPANPPGLLSRLRSRFMR